MGANSFAQRSHNRGCLGKGDMSKPLPRAVTVSAFGRKVHTLIDPLGPRWRPGYRVPEGTCPDAISALVRHAEAHALEEARKVRRAA